MTIRLLHIADKDMGISSEFIASWPFENITKVILNTVSKTTEKGLAQCKERIKKGPSQTDAYILTGHGGKSPHELPTGYEEPSFFQITNNENIVNSTEHSDMVTFDVTVCLH